MNKQVPEDSVPAEVSKYLSRNGKKGGNATSQYIEMGKKYAEEHGESIEPVVQEKETEPKRTRKPQH